MCWPDDVLIPKIPATLTDLHFHTSSILISTLYVIKRAIAVLYFVVYKYNVVTIYVFLYRKKDGRCKRSISYLSLNGIQILLREVNKADTAVHIIGRWI